MKDFIIQFSGLAESEHEFKFEVDSRLFEEFDNEDISDCNVTVDLLLIKQSRMMICEFGIKGTVTGPCDRCGEDFPMEIDNDQRLIIKIGNEEEETQDDDILIISEEEYEIDMSDHIYDYINLMLPMKRTHEESSDGSDCDEKMLKLLEEHKPEENIDPRWESLKNLNID